MRVVFLSSRKSVHTVRWVNALSSIGHEIHLVSMESSGDPLDESVVVHKLPYSGQIGYFANVLWLKRLLKRINPDLLHASYASGYGTLGRLSGYHPFVLSVWGSDVFLFPEKSFIHKRLIQGNLRSADWVCSTSNVMADRVRELCPDLSNLTITPFGIDLEKFAPALREIEGPCLTIGTVKGLRHVYGVDLLIRAFARARERMIGEDPRLAGSMCLKIVGSGSEGTLLKLLASECGLDDCCEFVSHVSHENVPECLRQLDVYVAASRSESFGVAVLEASACGLPVIVSDVGGLPEVVDHEQTGLVVKSGDVEQLADSISALSSNPALRREMGCKGRSRVQELYSWPMCVRRLEEVYLRFGSKEG